MEWTKEIKDKIEKLDIKYASIGSRFTSLFRWFAVC